MLRILSSKLSQRLRTGGRGKNHCSCQSAFFCSNPDNGAADPPSNKPDDSTNNPEESKVDQNQPQDLTTTSDVSNKPDVGKVDQDAPQDSANADNPADAQKDSPTEDKEEPCKKEDADYLKGNLGECWKLHSEWSEGAQAYIKHVNENKDPSFPGLKSIKTDSRKVFDAWRYLFSWYEHHIEVESDSDSDDNDDDDSTSKECDKVETYKKLVDKDKCPAHVWKVIEEQLVKLKEYDSSYLCEYLDWLTAVPWGKHSEEDVDIDQAETILDEDHYGLKDVKERILEFIAVGILNGTTHGKIICLLGPPGVGKTSIARSIARVLGRKFYKFSVGGLSDANEIKGHNRVYISSRPGKIVHCLKTVGTMNPVVLLDEIDKLGDGHKASPADALLELLDPVLNENFIDYYLEVPIDVSKVLFVCTANDINRIPIPLLDRMEIIPIAGYTTEEKMHIAKDYLDKSVREACGIKPEQAGITDETFLVLAENYCREEGVRNLQKHIEKIYRKIALQLVRKGVKKKPSPVVPTEVIEAPASGKTAEGEQEVKSECSIAVTIEDPASCKNSERELDVKSESTIPESMKDPDTSKTVEREPNVIPEVILPETSLDTDAAPKVEQT